MVNFRVIVRSVNDPNWIVESVDCHDSYAKARRQKAKLDARIKKTESEEYLQCIIQKCEYTDVIIPINRHQHDEDTCVEGECPLCGEHLHEMMGKCPGCGAAIDWMSDEM